MTKLVRFAALALAASALACGALDEGARPHADDAHDEKSYSGDALAGAFVREGEFFVSPLLENEHGATRVGFLLDVEAAAAGVHLEARGYDVRGMAGEWLPALFTWAEGTMRVGRVDLPSIVYAAELRVPAAELPALFAITYSLVVPDEGARDPGFDATASRPLPVDLAPAGVIEGALLSGVNPRAAWGARATGCTSLNTTKTKISVHHTAGPSSPSPDYPARLRGIQAYHMDSRGWCDVGYHYLVTKDGQRWEGREAKFLGAHVLNNNTNNLGVSFVGCFQNSGCSDFTPFQPPQEMLDGGGDLIGKAATHYGITVNSSTVIGHRDNPGQSTACPGDNLHAKLGELRSIATGGGGGGTTPPPPSTGTVQGVVWDLSITTDASQSAALNARLPGATVQCSCGQTATAREGDAFWSFDIAPGTYTFTATKQGFAPASRELQVTSGGELWGSIGIAPEPTSADVTVFIFDADTNAAVANATVEVTGSDPAQTGPTGELAVTVNAGEIVVKASAESYEPGEVTRVVAAGAQERIELGLVPILVDEPEPEPEPDPGEEPGDTDPVQQDDVARVVVPYDVEAAGVAQGCACVLGGDSESGDPSRGVALAALLGLGLMLRRRRR